MSQALPAAIGNLVNESMVSCSVRIDFAKLDKKMATVRDAIDQHESQMLLMSIRGAETVFVAP
jgi:hypothetical protein